MKLLLGIGALLSFLALASLPIGYYTFLRIYLTLVAGYMAFVKYGEDESINIWVVLFGVTAILFNPIIPVYLHDKSTWSIIDIAVGVLFGISALRF